MKNAEGKIFCQMLKFLIPLSIMLITLALLILFKAFMILEQPQTVADIVEVGTINLSANHLSCPVGYIEGFKLYTNSTRIVVEVESDTEYSGTVVLWNVDDAPQEIMISDISTRHSSCVFTNLPAESRYKITLEGISSGRAFISGKVDFGQAVSLAVEDLFF